MAVTLRYYRLRVRDATDAADALVVTSVDGGTNPFITQAPSGDGESIDPITGKPTTGSYTVRAADPEITTNNRVVTSVLADVNARQQFIARKAYVEVSADGTTWTSLVVGYVTAVRLVNAIEYEFEIGQSRRIEQSKEIFKNATTTFPATTSIIGGPIFGGFGTLVLDNGGWRFYVNAVNSSPNYIQIKLKANGGFDPRKDPTTTFSTITSAIADYTNNYARPYFEPFATSDAFVTGPDIQGSFPQMRVRLIPITNPANPTLEFVPLSEPEPAPGSWWTRFRTYDNLTRSGTPSLWLPKDCVDVATGLATTFTPAVNDEFDVYGYAVPVSENNPLHVFQHPVDLWENLMIDAGIAYDATVLPALKTLIGDYVKLALRETKSSKLGEYLLKTIYGAFRLSTRIEDGKQVLISLLVRGQTPVQTITIDDLRSFETTVFDLDEQTVVTAVTLKTLRLYPWSTEEKEQPNADSIIAIPLPTQSVQNADDDIPTGAVNEVQIGDISGMILNTNTDYPTDPVPVNFDNFLSLIGDEMFQRFGRGGIACELECLPTVTAKVGELVTLDLPHFPGASVSQSPVSIRGTTRNFQVVQRTEQPEGPKLKLVDATVTDSEPVGVGGGSEEETDVTATVVPTPIAFPSGTGAIANWADSYPQFSILIAWEAHAASESTFNELYDGETELQAGVTSNTRPAIGTGWVARCRIKYFNGVASSAFSSYSNEVTCGGSAPATPTDVPDAPVATSTVTDQAHGEWLNPDDTTDQIRINWQASTEVSSPVTWGNVAGGNRLLAANTTSDDQPTGAGTFARFRVAYVNSAGTAGPYSDWSAYTAIAP